MLGIPTTEPMKSDIKKDNAAEFNAPSDDVFNRIASRYDFLCDLFSLGLHRVWKRGVAAEIKSTDWKVLVDGASGTGDIVLRTLAKYDSLDDRRVLAADLSPAMLEIARKRLRNKLPRHNVQFEVMNAESMQTIKDNSVDCFSFSLAAKICDRALVFQEAHRILKPGGKIILLEASTIPNRLVQKCYLSYMKACMPLIGWIATRGDSSAYLYLLRGIEEFPDANGLKDELEGYGFHSVGFKRYTFGIVAIHRGTKN